MNNDTSNFGGRLGGQPQQTHFFDYLYVLVKKRKFIITTVLAAAIITSVVTLLLPNWYAATASVLPPKRPGGLLSLLEGSFGSILKTLPGVGGRFGVSQESYSYLAILNSRTAMEEVVRKFELIKVYDVDDGMMEKAIKKLRSNAEFELATEGNIAITVYDKDPPRAAAIANYFVELLNRLSADLGSREARGNREFIERRYQQNQRDLKNAEDSLKAFQEKTGIYALPEQVESAIKAASELKTEALTKEVELGIAKRSLGVENPRTQTLRLEVAELNKKFLEMKLGTPDWFEEQSPSLFVPFKNVPELGTTYLRLYREFQIQNKLMEFLLPLYEQAKIDEKKDTPVVLVLDTAVPPQRKSKPKRTLIVLIFTALAFMFASSWAFLSEIYDREKERNAKVAAIADELKRGRFYQNVLRRFHKTSSDF